MKYMTTRKHTYRYSGIVSEAVRNPNGPDTYKNPQTFNFAGGKSTGGNMLIYTDYPIKQYSRVDTMKDVEGLLLMEQEVNSETGQIYVATQVQPVLNIYGFREGFRVTLRAIS